jgi:hypothetical protein
MKSATACKHLPPLTRALFLVILAGTASLFGQSKPNFDSVAIGAFDPQAWNGIVFLARDGTNRFQADAGVVVRNYEAAPSRLAFTIDAPGRVTITTSEFQSGTLNLQIDGRAGGLINVKNGGASFQLPEGRHAVELTRNTK